MPAPQPLPAIATPSKLAPAAPCPPLSQLRSQSAPESLSFDTFPSISHWTRWGGIVIVTSVAIAIALSAVTPYSVTVQAEAMIRPTGELKRVEARMAGTVIKLLAHENQAVQKGQVLAYLDDSAIQTRKRQLESKIEQAQLQTQQINTQIQNLELRIQAERDRNLQALRSGRAHLQQARRIHQEQKITASSNVDAALAELRAEQASLDAATSNAQRYQSLVEEGAVARITLETVQLQVRQHQGEIGAMQARLQRLQAALNPSAGEIAIAEENIAQEVSHHNAAIAGLNQEKASLIQQRIEIQQRQRQDQQELQQTLQDLRKNEVIAPLSGTLFQLQLRNPGQSVTPGTLIAQIAPQNSVPTIKAIVPNAEISHVSVGQIAQIRIKACPYTEYGTVKAVVETISPDLVPVSTAGQKTPAQMNGYEIALKPEQLKITHGKQHCHLQPGMGGRADITTHEETILSFMLRKIHLQT